LKLWLDDHRPPPDDSWFWAKDIEEAKEWLLWNQCSEQSLDHDLGPGKSDGLTLVVWEYDRQIIPLLTICHSWNRAGADRITRFLHTHKQHAVSEPDPRPPR
jgi:hypothetical protein